MTSAAGCFSPVLDADLRFALDNRPDGDIIRRCLVYIHKVINARGRREKTQVTSQQTEVFAFSCVANITCVTSLSVSVYRFMFYNM